MMRYGDMPDLTPGHKNADGSITVPHPPQMMCEDCGAGPYSATRGDYFQHSDDEEVTCECGGSMVLVREVHYFEPVTR